MFPNSVKLPSIILIATLCSLASPDLTAFFFCVGVRITLSPHKSRKKAVWPCETTQFECCEDFLLRARLINLQQVDYTRQLCIRCSHESSIQLKSLNRRHRLVWRCPPFYKFPLGGAYKRVNNARLVITMEPCVK